MSQTDLILNVGLFILASISGMLGLGVAFAAVPFLSFFMPDLVHQVQPLSLLLNGVTALFSVFGFAQSKMIDWKKAIVLAVVTTISAPAGAWLVQFVPAIIVWIVYLAAVTYLAYRLFRPVAPREAGQENFTAALALAVPISILSGFLGVGPGFLLMPTLIIVGFAPKRAAAINAFAVTPPSFSAVLPHLKSAQWDIRVTVSLLIVGAIGSYLGARISARRVPGDRLKQMFGGLIVVVTAYKVAQLVL